MLSILIRKQEIMKNGQCLEPKVVLTCVGNSEMRRNGKVIDPILDEMFMIRFQPFYDFGRVVGSDGRNVAQNQLPRRKRHPFNLEGELMTTMGTSQLPRRKRHPFNLEGELMTTMGSSQLPRRKRHPFNLEGELMETSPLRVGFKNWDERLLNHIVDTPCMRYNLNHPQPLKLGGEYRSVNHV